MVDGLAPRLLGRHIGVSPQEAAGARLSSKLGFHRLRELPDGLDELGEPEVDDLYLIVAQDHDVCGLQIAVNDALFMRADEPPGDLLRDSKRARKRERALPQKLAQSFPLDELHDDEGHTVGLVDFVNDGDVGMLEGGRGLGLLDETALSVLVGDELRGKDFHRHFALQTEVEGAIDDSHSDG